MDKFWCAKGEVALSVNPGGNHPVRKRALCSHVRWPAYCRELGHMGGDVVGPRASSRVPEHQAACKVDRSDICII